MAEWLKRACIRVMFVCSLGLSLTPSLHAQDANNVLGLPAVPQRPAAPASGTAPANNKPAAARPTDAQIKAVLSGKINAATSYQDGLVTLRISTERLFIDSEQRARALQAAKLIQRDVRLACGTLCEPAPMPAPALQADNTLSFDIVVKGYVGSMSNADMINLVSGERVKGATQVAPAAVPARAASRP